MLWNTFTWELEQRVTVSCGYLLLAVKITQLSPLHIWSPRDPQWPCIFWSLASDLWSVLKGLLFINSQVHSTEKAFVKCLAYLWNLERSKGKEIVTYWGTRFSLVPTPCPVLCVRKDTCSVAPGIAGRCLTYMCTPPKDQKTIHSPKEHLFSRFLCKLECGNLRNKKVGRLSTIITGHNFFLCICS